LFDRTSPAVENNLSTSVDVGGGVRNFFAILAKASLISLVEFFSYSFLKAKEFDEIGLSKKSSKISFANFKDGV